MMSDTFYDCDEHADRFTHRSQFDAIEAYLDGYGRGLSDLPKTVTVRTFRRRVATEADCGSPLEHVIEALDDEFGGEDGGVDGAEFAAMREAEKVFLSVCLANYTPWQCEEDEAARVEIDVLWWIRTNRPEWLEAEAKP